MKRKYEILDIVEDTAARDDAIILNVFEDEVLLGYIDSRETQSLRVSKIIYKRKPNLLEIELFTKYRTHLNKRELEKFVEHQKIDTLIENIKFYHQ
ncbi:MAG: hypothetical protein U9N59_11405 [Campylobacterota bacterium]|nr:hypothetical protein [Campylobacterota bacterium]